MKDNKKSKISRHAVLAIAAAATFAAATITVAAVTGWSFNDAFNAIFSKEDTSAVQVDNDISSEQLKAPQNEAAALTEADDPFDFEAYGKTLDLRYTFDDYTLNVKAISADKTTAYVLYDVIFDAAVDCAPRDGWDVWWLHVTMDALEEGEETAPVTRVNRSHCELISQNRNILSFYGSMSLSDINDTLENKTVTLDFGELFRMLPSVSEKEELPWRERQEFECGVHIEVPVDFAVCTDGKRYDIDKPIELVECVGGETLTTSAQLVSFTATPFSSELYLTLDTSDYEKGDGPYIKLSVELADGTAIIHDVIYRITDGAVSCRSVFTEPTDPEKIVAVTVNENTFELY